MATNQAAERRVKALELHLAGATYAAIAKAVGYASTASSYKAVQQALDQLGETPAMSEAVGTELARLDAMLTGLWPKARRGDVNAVDRVLKIGERRTQLLSINTPTVAEGTALDELTTRRRAAGRPDATDSTRPARAAQRS